MRKNLSKGASILLAAALIGTGFGNTTVFATETAGGTEDVVYTDKVVTDVDMDDYSCEDTAKGVKVVIEDEKAAEEIQEGNIILLPADDGTETERAVEVTSVVETEEGTVIEGVEPESFEDVVEHVDVEGAAGADVAGIETEEGVSVQVGKATRSIGGSGTADITPLRFQFNRSFGEYGSAKGSIVMTPTLEYKVFFNLGGLEEFELKQCGRLEVTDLSIKGEAGGVIPIATIPYTFAGGMFTAYANLRLVYTASGEAYLDCQIDGAVGVRYDGQESSFICDYNPEHLSYGIGSTGDVGANLTMGLTAYGTYSLMDVEINTGISATERVDFTEDPNLGLVYFYLNGNFGQNSVLKEYGVCGSKVFYDRNNSPLKYDITF